MLVLQLSSSVLRAPRCSESLAAGAATAACRWRHRRPCHTQLFVSRHSPVLVRALNRTHYYTLHAATCTDCHSPAARGHGSPYHPPTHHSPTCRPLLPDDYAALKLLHQKLFPLDYDDEFFRRTVHGMDDIVSWAALAPLPALTQLSLSGNDDLAPQLHTPPAWQPPSPQHQQWNQEQQHQQHQHQQHQQHQQHPQPWVREEQQQQQQQLGSGRSELLTGFITGKRQQGGCCM